MSLNYKDIAPGRYVRYLDGDEIRHGIFLTSEKDALLDRYTLILLEDDSVIYPDISRSRIGLNSWIPTPSDPIKTKLDKLAFKYRFDYDWRFKGSPVKKAELIVDINISEFNVHIPAGTIIYVREHLPGLFVLSMKVFHGDSLQYEAGSHVEIAVPQDSFKIVSYPSIVSPAATRG